MSRRRRVTVLLAVALVGTAGAGWLRSGGSEGETPRQDLEARLTAIDEPSVFAFQYSGAGTKVVDCFLPNRQFFAIVDKEADVEVFKRSASDTVPIAVVTAGRALLHRSLFRDGLVPTPWLRIPVPPAPEARTSLQGALGVDLAGYVLRPDATASAAETARAALEVSRSVLRIGSSSVGDRYRIRVEPEEFEAATRAAGQAGGGAPVVDVWFKGDAIRRIAVAPARPADQTGEVEAAGWVLDYSEPSTAPPSTVVGSVTDVAELGGASLTGSRTQGCSLPL